MSKGKPAAQKVTTEETKLPSWLEPAMQRGVTRAEDVYQQGQPELFPGSMQVPFSQQTTDALGQMEGIARGNPTQGVMDAYDSTLAGDFINGPGFNRAFQAASNRIIPQVESQFSRSGRTGSGLAQTSMTSALGDSFANLYNQERNRMQGAMSMAPTMEQLRYQPAQQLAGVGGVYEDQQARELQEQMMRHDYGQQGQARSLDEYLSRLQGIAPYAGGTVSQSSPLYRNRGAGILGGAASGAQLGSAFGPWGTAIGAVGGGLLGMS